MHVLKKLTLLAENKLLPQELSDLQTHLSQCECCQRHLAELNGGDSEPELPPEAGVRTKSGSGGSTTEHTNLLSEPVSLQTESQAASVFLRSEAADESQNQIEVGQVFENYQILGKLGEGGFGRVYRAVQLDTKRHFALKVLSSCGRFSESYGQLLAEARRCCQISHPHVATAYEVLTTDQHDFLVMDLIEGPSFRYWLNHDELPVTKIVDAIRQVASGLSAMHKTGKLHLDIKPSNLLLESASGAAKIIDFGLQPDDERTENGQVVAEAKGGTLAYMSPEHVVGDQVDERSEVYSLGVVLYELLVGQRPFLGTRKQLRDKILSEPPPSPRQLRKSIPQGLAAITLKCLEKAPSRRYGTTRELAEDLERWQKHQPILARSPDLFRRSYLLIRRNPLQSAALLAGTLILTLTTGWALYAISAQRKIQRSANATKEANTVLREKNEALGRMAVERITRKPFREEDWALVFEAFPEYQLPENLVFAAIDFAKADELERAEMLLALSSQEKPDLSPFIEQIKRSPPLRVDTLLDRHQTQPGELNFNLACAYALCGKSAAKKGLNPMAENFAQRAFELLKSPEVLAAIHREGRDFENQYRQGGDLAWLHDEYLSEFNALLTNEKHDRTHQDGIHRTP